MVITESELRELWRDGRHPLPPFPPGTRFSPAALDFLKDHGLSPVFAVDLTQPPAQRPAASSNSQSTPLFLARLDTLHALSGLVAAEARRARLSELAAHLDTLTAYCGELRAAAGQGRKPANLVWGGGAAAAEPARPGPHDHAVAHWLNYLGATAREAALTAPEDLQPALTALAHAVEDLLRRFLSGVLAWRAGGP